MTDKGQAVSAMTGLKHIKKVMTVATDYSLEFYQYIIAYLSLS